MSDSQLSGADTRDKWIRLVGRFILAFGDIELVSFMLWERYHPEKRPSHNFKERTSELLGPLRCDTTASDAIPALLEDALRMANKRNTVAHHPLQVQVFQHSTTGKYHFEDAIASVTTDDYITDEELESLGIEAERIGNALHRAMFPNWPADVS